MSIKTKIAALTLATVATMTFATSQAQARHFGLGWGIGAGIVGAAIVGSAIAADQTYYDDAAPRRCGWVRQFDAYGNYVGKVRVCD